MSARVTAARFGTIYFTLFFLPWPVVALFSSDRLKPCRDYLVGGVTHFWKPLVDFEARSLFHISHPVPIAFADTSSGDRLFDWLLVFTFLVIASLATVVWSKAQPASVCGAPDLVRIHLRYTLGSVLITYGFMKFSQFPAPSFAVLNKSFGEESPMGLMWAFVGASPGYVLCIAVLEILCGALLLFRRTTLVGACLSFLLFLNIALLNVFYDIPVKLFSIHLLVGSLVLLWPDLGRLAGFFLGNGFESSAPSPRLETPSKGQRIAHAIKACFLTGIALSGGLSAAEGYAERTRPKLPVEGIWKVTNFESSLAPRQKAVSWEWLTIDKNGSSFFYRLWLSDGTVASGVLKPRSQNALSMPSTGPSGSMNLHLTGSGEIEGGGIGENGLVSTKMVKDHGSEALIRHRIHFVQEAPEE